jgi:hypothetical protein
LKPFVLLFSSILSFMFLDLWLFFYFLDHLSPYNLVNELLMSLIYFVLRIGFVNFSVSALVGIEHPSWSLDNIKCLAFAAAISGFPLLTFSIILVGSLAVVPGLGRILSNLNIVPLLFIMELFRFVYYLRVKRSCSDSTTLPEGRESEELIPLKKIYALCALSALSFSFFDVSLSNTLIGQSPFSSITPVMYLLLFLVLRTGLANLLTDWVMGSWEFKIGFKDTVLAFIVYSLPLNTIIYQYSVDPFVFYLPTYAWVYRYLVIIGLPSLLGSFVSRIFLALVYDFSRLILLLELKRHLRCV